MSPAVFGALNVANVEEGLGGLGLMQFRRDLKITVRFFEHPSFGP